MTFSVVPSLEILGEIRELVAGEGFEPTTFGL